jgi:leucyl aminopeptidase
MNALVLALAVMTGVAGSGPATSDVWITIDRDVLTAFERGGAAWESTANVAGAAGAPREQVIAVAMSEARIEELVQFIHERYHRCGGFIAHANRAEALDAAARALHNEALERMLAPMAYTIDNYAVVQGLKAQILEQNIRNTITALSAFVTRRHNCPSGLQSATWIRDQWLAYAQGRPDVTVEFYAHPTTPQPSVILTIPGTTFPSEVVVLGGHQDSTAGSNCTTSFAPGADDDASGIATLSEVIRAAMLLGYQPQRTVKFMAYAAEEAGLLGSNHIAAQFLAQGVNVVGVIQFDMTNYAGTPGADIVFFTDFTNVAQNAFIRDLAVSYIDVATADVPRLNSMCGYGCSDHAAWHNRGFVASFPFESTFSQSNPFIHTQNDTITQSGGHARHAVPFSKLAAAYMAELAKGGFTARPEGASERTAPRKTTARRKDVGR